MKNETCPICQRLIARSAGGDHQHRAILCNRVNPRGVGEMKTVICQRCGNEFGTTCTRGDVKWCPDCRPIVAQEQRQERYRANFVPAPGKPDDNYTLGGWGWNCLALATIKLAVSDMRGECCENNRPPLHVMAEAALWLTTTGADWMRVLEGDDAADALTRMAKAQLKQLEAEWRTS